MKELKLLESKIEKRLEEIRNIGNERKQTVNELNEYTILQQKLRELHSIMNMLKEI